MARFNDLHRIAASMPEAAEQVVDAYQGYWVDGAKQFAPVDEGDLRDSIGPAPGDGQFSRRVVATAEHAPHQEFGTIHQPGTPFMRESRRALAAPFKRDVKRVFGQ